MPYGRNKVTVEPSKAPNVPGGVKWNVVVGGGVVSRHNYKDKAKERARQKARSKNAVLEILDTNMNVVTKRDYA